MHIQRITEDCRCNNCNDRELGVAYKIYLGSHHNSTTVITLCRPCIDNLGFMIGTEQQRTSPDMFARFMLGDEEDGNNGRPGGTEA